MAEEIGITIILEIGSIIGMIILVFSLYIFQKMKSMFPDAKIVKKFNLMQLLIILIIISFTLDLVLLRYFHEQDFINLMRGIINLIIAIIIIITVSLIYNIIKLILLEKTAYNRVEFYKDLLTHDISNILQGILSGMELSEIYIENSEKLKEINRMIKDQIMRGAKLVSNIRKLSELEETEISIKQIEICNILENTITFVKNSYHDKNITIQIDSISKKLYIQANALLEDVFENILVNAVKFNENPIVEVIIKISKEKRESINYLKLEFLDNCMGIDDLRKKLIFQRESSQEKSVYGMGLGLSLVKKIIDSYDGKIWVEDRVKGDHSKGNNFVLLIPDV